MCPTSERGTVLSSELFALKMQVCGNSELLLCLRESHKRTSILLFEFFHVILTYHLKSVLNK